MCCHACCYSTHTLTTTNGLSLLLTVRWAYSAAACRVMCQATLRVLQLKRSQKYMNLTKTCFAPGYTLVQMHDVSIYGSIGAQARNKGI